MVEFNHTNTELPALSYDVAPLPFRDTLTLIGDTRLLHTISGRLDSFQHKPKTAFEKTRGYVEDNIVYRDYSLTAVAIAFLLGALLF